MGGVGIWGLEMMWGPSRQCGDDGDNTYDVGTTGTMWGPETMETTGHGDLLGAMGMTWTTGTTWGGDHRDHSHGDLLGAMGMTGTMWGPRGQQNH